MMAYTVMNDLTPIVSDCAWFHHCMLCDTS